MNGFSFRGRHSNTFGAVVKSKLRPLLPEEKSVFVSPMMMDGSYDFSAANPYSRQFYMDRIFEVTISVTAGGGYELSKKVSKIAEWLSGRGELIFDDMPTAVWYGAVISGLSYEMKHSGRAAQFTAAIKTSPFSEWLLSVQDEVYLGMGLPIGEDVPLAGFGDFFTATLTAGENSLTFKNIGERPARPKLLFTFPAAVDELAVSCGGKTVELLGISAEEITVDLSSCTATGDEVDITPKISGDFFELPQGNAALAITSPSAGTVKFDWHPQFFYAANINTEILE